MQHPFWQALSESGFLGNTIMVILFGTSIVTWTVIIQKFFLFRQVNRSSLSFLARFRRAQQKTFSLPPPSISSEVHSFYRVYRAGCNYLTGKEGNDPGSERLKSVLVRAAEGEISYLSRYLITLATAGTTGPLLGILGTIWGVLQAFRSMGQFGSASIGAVAPGISVALITTVAGLVVAIPAVVAYNYFNHYLEKFAARLDGFVSDFLQAADDHPERIRLERTL